MSETKLLEEISPADRYEMEATKRALDELFVQVRQYKSGKSYTELIKFVSRFRFYSAYNAMLIHIQMPGAVFVAPAHRWLNEYDRIIRTGTRPLVILQPMGPVMFVFDVADTEEGKNPKPLPKEVTTPFDIRKGSLCNELVQTIENAKRDGIRITKQKQGSQSAGSIQRTKNINQSVSFRIGIDRSGDPIYKNIPVRYELIINENLNKEAQYTTLIHELAHLYCGHLGTINDKWWPNRLGLSKITREFEAESISYLVCRRIGIDIPADEYLSNYKKDDQDIPNISLELVMKVVGLIENMGKRQLSLRKQPSSEILGQNQAKKQIPGNTRPLTGEQTTLNWRLIKQPSKDINLK